MINHILAITELQALRSFRPGGGSYLTLLFSLVLLPLPMLFFTRYLAPPGDEVGPRLLAGAIVFSVGLNTVGFLATQLNQDRFTYRLKFIRGCAVHPFSYAAGMLIAGSARALLNACLILLFAPLFGIQIDFNLWFFPIVGLTSVSLSGLALIIGTWSPTWEYGNLFSNIAGTFIALASPVFYPISRLPDWLEPIAQLSPYTHAAQALTGIFSGNGSIDDEVAILTAITLVGVIVGMAGMRWREN